MSPTDRLSRRSYLAAAGAVAGSTTLLAGCLDYIPFVGDSPIGFSATPAMIPADALEDTGYEERDMEEFEVTRTYEVAGQTQDIVATNWMTEYVKKLDLGPLSFLSDEDIDAAILTALSTPQVDVLGQTFNPVGDMNTVELAEMVQDQYDEIDSLEHIEDTQGSVAGIETIVSEFKTDAELLSTGMRVDLTLHISEAVALGDDFIIAIGGYPSMLEDQEREHIFSLMDTIEHT